MAESLQVVIYGAGGHGRVVAEIIDQVGDWSIVGFVDDDPALEGSRIGAYPVLGDRRVLQSLRERGVDRCIIAIGSNSARRQLAALVNGLRFELITVIDPGAHISAGAVIGEGSVVEACSVVKTGSSVGRVAIINSCVSIGHDTILAEGVHVSPGASIAGWVEIGEGTHIGMGASVIARVKIGKNVAVGANAAVIRDLPDNVVAVGVPARIIKEGPAQASPDGG